MQSIFGFIVHPMEIGLIWLVLHVGSAGIGIILFTVAVRLVLAPLQIVQLRSAKAMQRVQPQLNELRKKHGKDKEALTKATMELYKEHRVNPAMGCLPTLLQFPILIGLFYALLHLGASPVDASGAAVSFPHAADWAKSACNGHTVSSWAQWFKTCYAITGQPGNTKEIFTLFHADFLWLSNGLGGKDPYFILPILAGVTQWVQSRMMLTKTTDPQQQMMNTMTNFMPLLIVFFAWRYPSGLSLYWVTSTLIGILIQFRITGLGLLGQPGGLPNLAQLFSPNGSSPSTTRSKSTPRPAPTETAVKPEVNGQTEEATAQRPVSRPRKKANRARGGRGGGRRG